jgi:glycosyltransferase involved in cell wall biosynthesis
LESLSRQPKYAQQLRLIRLERNCRQGGARNRGVSQAQGDYIVFVDQDDWLNDGALEQVKVQLAPIGVDILMVDALRSKGVDIRCITHYAHNSQEIMSGEDYMCANEIPWSPWCYIYQRQFLWDNQLKFEENVRLEDTDWVMKVTLTAKRMTFRPIYVYVHALTDTQTTNVGKDAGRIRDLFFMAWRIRQVALKFHDSHPRGAGAVMGHYYFMYQSFLRRFLWRLSVSDILDILHAYPADVLARDWLTRFSVQRPRSLAYSMAALRPVLNGMWRVKRFIKR